MSQCRPSYTHNTAACVCDLGPNCNKRSCKTVFRLTGTLIDSIVKKVHEAEMLLAANNRPLLHCCIFTSGGIGNLQLKIHSSNVVLLNGVVVIRHASEAPVTRCSQKNFSAAFSVSLFLSVDYWRAFLGVSSTKMFVDRHKQNVDHVGRQSADPVAHRLRAYSLLSTGSN